MTLEITKHAEERYVERVMGYTDKQEIASYIVQNKDLISDRIDKMFEYGELLYSGKVKEGNFVNVIINGTWVLLTDRKNEKLITLYKVDLISDDEDFNKLFVDKMLEKINSIKSNLENHRDKYNEDIKSTRAEIESNKARIKQYEDLITKHRQVNNVLEDYIKVCDTEVSAIEHEYKIAIEDLVSNKIF